MNKGGSCCAPSCCGGEATKPSTSASTEPTQAIRETVKERYGAAAKAALQGGKSSCCGSGEAGLDWTDPITRDLYDAEQAAGVPAEALLASFGCGNPTALAQLKPGETVLDLGSGGGIDVLLSAKRVGPTGKAYGLDMTDEMLDLAQKNKAAAGATNVEFLKGHIESIPLPRASVDVIISNCVINLSGDKDAVINEAFRVLKPGGRFAVSDIVLTRDLPEAAKASMALWTGCVAGALLENEYVSKLRAAGFTHIEVEPTRVYSTDEMTEMASSAGLSGVEPIVAQMGGAIMSAFVRATKPM
ncbi:MAG: arsenite methyltransferase [Polyangiaceae bacterium]|nr:arsenite methyltransferase [Polyangiaceae bacterium]